MPQSASSKASKGSQPAPSQGEIDTLNTLVETSSVLVKQLEKTLLPITAGKDLKEDSPKTKSPLYSDSAQFDALKQAHDCARLIRAEATKISLLIINEPFTPSTLVKSFRAMNSTALPALANAVQKCDATRYTRTVRRDLSIRCGQVFRQLHVLLGIVPRDGKVLPPEKKNGVTGTTTEKGSVAITGVLWASCDEVIQFSILGVGGHLLKKVEQYRDTLKDIGEELKEWSEEDEDDEEEEDERQEGGQGSGGVDYHTALREMTQDMAESHISSTQAAVDELMGSHRRIPKLDSDKIRERLNSCLKRLRLTVLLYEAIIKRRLKTLPQLPTAAPSNITSRLDEVMPVLKKIPERFNDVAAAFYGLAAAEIDHLMDQCFLDAFAASELLFTSWDGQKDMFTDWVLRFQSEIKKIQ